jgi:2-dehydropantoate 2-reductase
MEAAMSRRIAILGTGANGAAIGADLANAQLDVTLIDQWPANVERIRAEGLRVVTPEETVVTRLDALHLCDVATLRGAQFDVVLLLVKAYDARWAAELIKPYLAPDGLLVGVQNGMTVDVIADVVGRTRTLGCVIEITSAMFEPAVVERHSSRARSWFAVGSLDSATEGREEEIASLLRHAGSVEVVEHIRAAKWMKLVSNATTLVTTAILGMPMIEAAGIPEMRRFMLRSGNEALEATLLLGNPIIPIFGLTPDAVRDHDLVVEMLLDTLLGGFVLPESKTTILQDWMKGRRSEVDDLNGLVVATHESHGGSAPANAAVVEFAHRIERGELRPGRGNLEPLLAFADRSTSTPPS